MTRSTVSAAQSETSVRKCLTQGGVTLTGRLLRAAAALRFHQEFLPCRTFEADGTLKAWELVGPGRAPGTVLVNGWWDRRGKQVRIEEIALPAAVAQRLEEVAAQQAQVQL